MRERLLDFNELIGVEVFAYSMMSNHTYVVLRTRPDWADPWSVDEEYYLSLVEWTGRHLRKDKPGYLPVDLQKVLGRFELDAKAWAKNVEAYGGLFYRIADKAEQLLDFAKSNGQRWFRRRSGSESLYRSDPNRVAARQKAA